MRRNILFVLADGGRARLVERSSETGHFVTIEEIVHEEALQRLRDELRASPLSRTFSSTSPRRSAIGREDFVRFAKEAFMAQVAQRAVALVRQRGFEGVFLAAPPQLIGPLRVGLDRLAPIVGAIRKDLTKSPDHELGAWLNVPLASPQLSL